MPSEQFIDFGARAGLRSARFQIFPTTWFALPFLGLCVFLSANAGGINLDDADRNAIRAVIQAQLDAFQAGDADQAFSFASPSVQQQFGDAQKFMDMVINSYPQVYRPSAVFFQDIVMLEHTPAQRVLLMDARGAPVMAVYPMKRQADGSWRIDGCYLFAGDAQML